MAGWFGRGTADRVTGLLGRLRRDARGNALAIMAAALIPLAGFTGCAVDAARLYAVKSRLQQACDAGVLAGRKDMIAKNANLDTTDAGPAKTFFYNNFVQGWFGTPKATFTPYMNTANNNYVEGDASVAVPMTIMAMFGQPTKTISVTCEAMFDPADTNIMFVLDTTGSMACLPADDENSCDSYVSARKNPYSSTDLTPKNLTQDSSTGAWYANEETGGTSRIQSVRDSVLTFYDSLTGQADPTTNFRFGIVPFSATVSVGNLLRLKGYMATQWPYQSRTSTGGSYYTYARRSLPVGDYVKSIDKSNGTVLNPAQSSGQSPRWAGCVEERGNGLDLDIDTAPSGSTVVTDPATTSYWGPLWPDVEFWRNSDNESSNAARTIYTRPIYGTAADIAVLLNEVACPLAASPLSAITLPAGGNKDTVRASIKNYMLASNGFRPYGVTYLDEGMIWGLRLLSPTGMFRTDGAAWPGRVAPKNIMIFLTDGNMETDCSAYSSHGYEQFDHRETSSCGTDATALDNIHQTRFATACSAAVSRKIQIYIIIFGNSVKDKSGNFVFPSFISNCAAGTGGKAYYASSTSDLNDRFKDIAQQVAMLRISK